MFTVDQIRITDNASVCTRMSLRYVWVFAIANSVCLSVVCNICAPQWAVETFGKISLPFCTLAILRPPCKILRRSSQENPSVGGIKCKSGSKIEWWWTYWRLYLIAVTYASLIWWGSCIYKCRSGCVTCVVMMLVKSSSQCWWFLLLQLCVIY